MKVHRENIKQPLQSKDIIVNFHQTLHLYLKRKYLIQYIKLALHLFNVDNKINKLSKDLLT